MSLLELFLRIFTLFVMIFTLAGLGSLGVIWFANKGEPVLATVVAAPLLACLVLLGFEIHKAVKRWGTEYQDQGGE